MLTRSQSTVNEAKKEISFFSKQLKRSLDARLLKKSRNMAYYIIVDTDFDKSKRQVNIIAEVSVRSSSFSAQICSEENVDYTLLEKELKDNLFNKKLSPVSSDLQRYPIAAYI